MIIMKKEYTRLFHFIFYVFFLFAVPGLMALDQGVSYLDVSGHEYPVKQDELLSFQMPYLNFQTVESGNNCTLSFNRSGIIYCIIYSRTGESEKPQKFLLDLKESENGLYTSEVFTCPETGILYAYWVGDKENQGVKSQSLIYDFMYRGIYRKDFYVVSPLPGEWDNLQTLVIDTEGSSNVVYTLDGSNPFENGIQYNGPVLLEGEGDFILRVADIGKNIETRIPFSQKKHDGGISLAQPENCSSFGSFLSSGESFSLTIPENTLYGININSDFSPVFPTEYADCNKNLLIGKNNTYLTLVVFDNDRSYLYTLFSGDYITSESDYSLFSDEDFHFLVFKNDVLIFENNSWNLLSEPLLVKRDSPHEVVWKEVTLSSNHAETKQLFLSRAAGTLDFDLNFYVNNKSALPQNDIHYNISLNSIPAFADKDSPLITDLNFVLPEGASGRFFLSLSLFDGEYISAQKICSFYVDEKSPFIPFLKIDDKGKYFFDWEVFQDIFDDDTETKIFSGIANSAYGEQFFGDDITYSEKNVFSLNDEDFLFPMNYQTKAYAVDSKKRTSLTVSKSGVVYPVGFYISSSGNPDGTGSFENPASSIDTVLSGLSPKQKSEGVVVFVSGELISKMKHNIDYNLEVRGLKDNSSVLAKDYGVIRFVDNGYFNIENGSLNLLNIYLVSSQKELRVHPLININNGLFTASDSMFVFQGDSQMLTAKSARVSLVNSVIEHSSDNVVLSTVFMDSDVCIKGSELNFYGSDFIQAVETADSSFSFDSCTVNLNSQTGAVNGILSKNSEISLLSCVFNTKTDSASRIVEAWNSNLNVVKSSFYLKNNNDVFSKIKIPALWLDSSSEFEVNSENVYQGFSNLFLK